MEDQATVDVCVCVVCCVCNVRVQYMCYVCCVCECVVSVRAEGVRKAVGKG